MVSHNSTKHKCPVCGEFEFEYEGCDEICEKCGWQDDLIQFRFPDEKMCANQMILNEAKKGVR